MNEEKESQHELIGMLNTLFSDTKSSKEIKDVLSSAYEIPMNTGYGREIDLMCNLSGRIEEKSLKQGMEQGIEQGMEKRKAEELINNIEALKLSLKISLEEAVTFLGKEMKDYKDAQELLMKKV